MIAKRLLLTIGVALLLVTAGCSGMPLNDESNPDSNEDPDTVTYTNESENGTFTLEVDHNTESYDMLLNGTVDSDDNFTRQFTVGAMCEVLSDTAYNYSDGEYSISGNESSYTKTTASGESEEASGLPDNVFQDYEPDTLRATIYYEGTKLNTCTVEGENEFSHETNAD